MRATRRRARDLAAKNVAAFAAGERRRAGRQLRRLRRGAARVRALAPGARATAFAGRVRDVCEFLDEVGRARPLRARRRHASATTTPAISSTASASRPRRAGCSRTIPELRLVPHADPGSCCGAAGIYNLTHRAMSSAVLARKLDALAAADPDWIATGNPGCLMQLRAGVRGRGLRAAVVHPVELLDLAASH